MLSNKSKFLKENVMYNFRIISAWMFGLASLAPITAFAQTLQLTDIEAIDVVRASLSPVIGEEVLNQSGVVDTSYFFESRVCTIRGCRVFIYDKRSAALIYNDGVWSEAYERTQRDKQVIRVKAFTDDERPKPVPSDEALDTAPAIKNVDRPSDDSKQ